MKLKMFFAIIGMLLASAISAQQNYPGRVALVVNVSPHVEITSFSFGNQARDRGRGLGTDSRFQANYAWKSTAAQPIVAIEMVMLKYDAFDERLIGGRFSIQGTSSVNWSPLPPGQSAQDGSIGLREEDVFTGIAYVRKVRLADGTVWRVDEATLERELRKVAPNLRNLGSLAADPKTPPRE